MLAQKMRSSNKGFTLAELLLSAAILAFALTGILALFINCMFLNETSREITVATCHAQYVMEGVRHTSFAGISNDINNNVWDWNSAAIQSAGMTPLPSESITTTALGANPLNVTVTVSWTGRRGRARNLVLDTAMTNY